MDLTDEQAARMHRRAIGILTSRQRHPYSVDDVDDLAQDTMLHLLRASDKEYRGEDTENTLVFFKTSSAYRDSVRRAIGRDGAKPPTVNLVGDACQLLEKKSENCSHLGSIETYDSLEHVLGLLTSCERQVFELRVLDELPWNDVADELGWPVSTTMKTFNRAKDRLQELVSLDELLP